MSTSSQYTLKPTNSSFPAVRWDVKSKSAVYHVNILTSTCSCNHWQYRLYDKPEPERRCKHILAAREHALDLVINNLRKVVDGYVSGVPQ